MTRLLLVRHGRVQSDQGGRYWGHTDIPLSTQGLMQAKRLCDRLSSEPIAFIYASDLLRARDTAASIATAHEVSVVPCPALREIDFGLFEGATFDEICQRDPESARFWVSTEAPLSFPQGESASNLADRVDGFLVTLLAHGPADTVLVVAHGGPLRMLVCRLLGLSPLSWWRLRLDLASLSIIETYPEGSVLCLLNDTSHLASTFGDREHQ